MIGQDDSSQGIEGEGSELKKQEMTYSPAF